MSHFILREIVLSDSSSQPGSLLDSESDGSFELDHFRLKGFVFSNKAWLLAHGVDLLTNELDELELKRLRDQKNVVSSGPFLNQLGLFGKDVDFVQGLGVDSHSLGLVDMSYGSYHTHRQISFDWMIEDHSGVELLLLVWVEVS